MCGVNRRERIGRVLHLPFSLEYTESEYRQSIFGLLELNYDELHLNGQLGNYRIPLDTSNVQNHYDERLNHKEKIFILKVVFIYQ